MCCHLFEEFGEEVIKFTQKEYLLIYGLHVAKYIGIALALVEQVYWSWPSISNQ